MENLKEIRFIVCSWGNPDQDKEYELWDFISENYLEKKKKKAAREVLMTGIQRLIPGLQSLGKS